MTEHNHFYLIIQSSKYSLQVCRRPITHFYLSSFCNFPSFDPSSSYLLPSKATFSFRLHNNHLPSKLLNFLFFHFYILYMCIYSPFIIFFKNSHGFFFQNLIPSLTSLPIHSSAQLLYFSLQINLILPPFTLYILSSHHY